MTPVLRGTAHSQCVLTRDGYIGAQAAATQAPPDDAGELHIIFDDQDAHRSKARTPEVRG